MADPVPIRGYHNIQQLSDAVVALETASNDAATNAAAFLVSEIQPVKTATAALQTQVAELAAQIKAVTGAK